MSNPPHHASASHPALTRLFGDWVQRVTPATVRADALAGLLGAVLVLPQGIAFATLAGLPPEYGLYTAVVPCIIAALFGSSWHVMSGPTNANSLALFAMLSPLAVAFSPGYIQLALAITVMVGVMQWLIGALRLGVLANFISPAVLFGFTSGAALLIAVHALPDLLGLGAAAQHSALGVLRHVVDQLGAVQPVALLIAGITLVVALLARGLRRPYRKLPYMLIGLVAATAVSWGLARFTGLPTLRTIGLIATPWPHFQWPSIGWSQAAELLGLAFALTIVALGQGISIAKTVAQRSGQRIDANREFRGQGLSNIVGGFFSCYVSCGSMNRSMPNLEAGAQTPLASVFSAGLLLALVAVSSGVLALIPMAALAALLMLVALALVDVARWQQLARLSRTDFFIAAATALATVTIRLETAILLGMILSLMSFLWRTSRPAMRTMGFDSRGPDRQFVVISDQMVFPLGRPEEKCAPSGGSEPHAVGSVGASVTLGRPEEKCAPSGGSEPHAVGSVGASVTLGRPEEKRAPSGGSEPYAVGSVGAKYLPECPQLKLLRMEGEVYFGATQHVADTLHALRHEATPQKHLLVMGKSMNFIDLAGAELWEAELSARRAMGGDLYFHRPRPEVIALWRKTGFTRVLGPEHQFPDKRVAIATIFNKLDKSICQRCTARIFWECQGLPGPDDTQSEALLNK